jgi:hypothetical protein
MLKIEEVTTENTYELRVIDARGEETVSYIGTEETICGLCLQDFVKVDELVEKLSVKYGEHDAKEIVSLLVFKEMIKKQLTNKR